MEAQRSENRLKTDKRRVPRSAFQAGQSGNPGGRPKRTPEELDLIAACKAKAPEALEKIVQLMDSADKDSVRLQAATFIIERGYGKAAQVVDSNKDGESIQHNFTVQFVDSSGRPLPSPGDA